MRHVTRVPGSVVIAIAVTAAATGCVAKSTLEQCQQENARLDEQVAAWEARFDREAERWESVEGTLTEALPRAVGEIHAERERILELVPAQVQDEVEAYLNEFFSTVMKGFDALRQDNETIRRDLEIASLKLEALGADTSELKDMSAALDQRMEAERAHRSAMTRRVAEIASQISEFDRTMINCKDCPDRLRLNRKEREAITTFHQQMIDALTVLQAEMQ